MLIEKILSLNNLSRTAVIQDGKAYNYFEFYNQICNAFHYFRSIWTGPDLRYSNVLPRPTCIVIVNNLHLCWITIISLRVLGFDTIVLNSAKDIGALNIQNIAAIIYADLEFEHYYKKFEHDFIKSQKTKILLFPVQFVMNPSGHSSRLTDDGLTHVSGHILYTSGTTGQYKLVRLCQQYDLLTVDERMKAYGINEETRYQNFNFSLYTSAGYRLPLSVWSNGGTVVFSQNVKPSHFIDVFNHPISTGFFTPFSLRELLEFKDHSKFKRLNDLKVFIGGGHVSENLAEATHNYLSPNIHIIYGATETKAMLSSKYVDRESLIWYTPATSEDFVIQNDNQTECRINEIGKLAIRISASGPHEYLNDAKTSQAIFNNEFFYPGDLAIKRADGKIRVLGRVSDVLNIGGSKVASGPIEDGIQKLIGADNICIFSNLGDDGTNTTIVVIESDIELRQDQILLIQNYLQGVEKISVKTISRFPRTETAMRKVDRKALFGMVTTI